jgi:hypothetical protein
LEIALPTLSKVPQSAQHLPRTLLLLFRRSFPVHAFHRAQHVQGDVVLNHAKSEDGVRRIAGLYSRFRLAA